MDLFPAGSRTRPITRLLARFGMAVFVAAAALLPAASVASAADVTMTAQPMLGGNVRPGAWAGFRVHLENTGPAISGELRITGGAQGSSTYGTLIELATGARQDQLLYAQPQWFGTKLTLQLVANGAIVVSQDLKVTVLDPSQPTIVVVAERPQGILQDVRAASSNPQFGQTPSVLTIKPQDLPPRVEAWSAIDRLVWQDSDSSQLSSEQLAALSTWVSAGGRFAIVGGSTGTTGLSAFPADLLPFVPTHSADATPADVAALLGSLPAGAVTTPVLAGTLVRGTVLGRAGDEVFAAQSAYGRGLVSIVGIDPATPWLAQSAAAQSLWRRLLPTAFGGLTVNPIAFGDDSILVAALNNLPAVELPAIGVLFVLLLAYIAVVGPLNYFVLKRLDRREWAWVTMPVLVLVFAVAAYGLGLSLKGTDVIINQVGVIRGAAGSDRGIGSFYVGVFAPSRHTFDVRVANGALLSNPAYLQQQGQVGVPLDVVESDPSHLRVFEVGFGVLRSFRAEASVAAPKIDTSFVASAGRIKGSLTNSSGQTLENVAVVYGGTVDLVGNLAPGATAQIDMDVSLGSPFGQGQPLSQQIFGTSGGLVSSPQTRTDATRRAVIDQITGGGSDTVGGYGATQSGPLVLAWLDTGSLGIQVDTEAQKVGDTLAVIAADLRMEGGQVLTTAMFQHNQLESTANDGFDQGGNNFSLGRGAMTFEFRPIGLDGSFKADRLLLALSQGELSNAGSNGLRIEPLPADQQPDQKDPLLSSAGTALDPTPAASGSPTTDPGSDNTGGSGGGTGGNTGTDPAPPPDLPGPVKPGIFDGRPDMQLFDRTTNRWVEFPHFRSGITYEIADAAHYVDGSGAFLVRFVNRAQDGSQVYFNMLQRLEGSIQ